MQCLNGSSPGRLNGLSMQASSQLWHVRAVYSAAGVAGHWYHHAEHASWQQLCMQTPGIREAAHPPAAEARCLLPRNCMHARINCNKQGMPESARKARKAMRARGAMGQLQQQAVSAHLSVTWSFSLSCTFAYSASAFSLPAMAGLLLSTPAASSGSHHYITLRYMLHSKQEREPHSGANGSLITNC
jgi:hypothetical protein